MQKAKPKHKKPPASTARTAFRDEVKMGLLMRNRELEAFRGLLQYLEQLPPQERYHWLDENVETLARVYSLVVDSSNHTIDHSGIDQESVQLSAKLIRGLDQVQSQVTKIINQNHQLRA